MISLAAKLGIEPKDVCYKFMPYMRRWLFGKIIESNGLISEAFQQYFKAQQAADISTAKPENEINVGSSSTAVSQQADEKNKALFFFLV